eukprot:1162152-Pelagomonas_calceolata.AAC.4
MSHTDTPCVFLARTHAAVRAWVTLPQLSLLEVALAQMPRIDAFILQRSGGAGGNVFWTSVPPLPLGLCGGALPFSPERESGFVPHKAHAQDSQAKLLNYLCLPSLATRTTHGQEAVYQSDMKRDIQRFDQGDMSVIGMGITSLNEIVP